MASTDGSIACHRPDFEAEAFKLFELDATGVDSLPSSTRHTVLRYAPKLFSMMPQKSHQTSFIKISTSSLHK